MTDGNEILNTIYFAPEEPEVQKEEIPEYIEQIYAQNETYNICIIDKHCPLCKGTGNKFSKKMGHSKLCKKCYGRSLPLGVRVESSNRPWCCCMKVTKTGRKKCRNLKQCLIF
jgi:hypothetical protein